ncbi:hypothetical protein CISG_09010 [Coccidioides immitis RMSCC 3703]|uniref:Arsenosugar biosynthesis radical SAM protein ArsS-like C-terminal domain-containing protein n=1 Tax=Coccidioides immitis RMSCC 3703 TaxID=454286 RepID=A0A0J8RAB6_COCIT|nr:hypothetical protein CISG_09010 [Coccidioides immitis RMSCC 3703]
MTLGNWLRLSPVRIRAEVCPATSCSRPSLRTASTGLPPRRRLRFEPAKIPTFADWLSKEEKEIQDANRKRRDKDLRWASDRIPKFHTVMESHQQWPLLRGQTFPLPSDLASPFVRPSKHPIGSTNQCWETLQPPLPSLSCGGGPNQDQGEHEPSGPCNEVSSHLRDTAPELKELTADDLLLRSPCITTVDITGGAPELNPYFQTLVREARKMGKTVIDRCNLVVLWERGQEGLVNFLAEQKTDNEENCEYAHPTLPDTLLRTGNYEPYMELLANAFNPQTVDGLMCRHTVNVGWDGKLYDCDFNGALEMGTRIGGRSHLDIWDIDNLEDLRDKTIRTGLHCFGCTAGAGSSCGGSLV